jgi:hypothetical protein
MLERRMNQPNGPYDPQPQPDSPGPAPPLPGHAPTEVPTREPLGVPPVDPGRPPQPGPSPQHPPMPTSPQPRA